MLLAALLLSATLAHADDLNFGGVGELHLPIPTENALDDGDRLRLRSVEATVQAKIEDAFLDGKLTIGGEDQAGDLPINIREAFLNANLGGDFSVRAGKFYLPVGLLNNTRRSAWSFITPPKVFRLFFTENGVVDTGADVAFENDHFNIRVGATNGYRFDSAVKNGGSKPKTPTHFARAEFKFKFGESLFNIAADYVARVNEVGDTMRIAGLDAFLASGYWLAQAEVYHRYQDPKSMGLAIIEELGGYIFAERGISEKSDVGLRADFYQIPSLTDAAGVNRKNLSWALSPVFSYHRNEHFTLQAEYTFLRDTRDGDSPRVEQVLEFRLVTEFGSVPRVRTPSLDRSSL